MMQSTLELPCILNRESTLREWMEDARGKQVFEPLFQQFIGHMLAIFDNHKGEVGAIEMETTNFLMELPLRDIFYFQEAGLPKPPDELVDDLLAQLKQLK